jgi:dual specificity MAP kinase phosphatase
LLFLVSEKVSQVSTRVSDDQADPYTNIEADHPEIVALDSEGCMTGKVMDFFHWERLEMCSMTKPSQISRNIWMGPTPDPNLQHFADLRGENEPEFDIMIEASDLAQIPDAKAFKLLDDILDGKIRSDLTDLAIPQLEFPGSGAIMPPTWSHSEVDGLVDICSWMYKQAHGKYDDRGRRDSKLSLGAEVDEDGDSDMRDGNSSGRKILIHCTDGYTESSLLGLAYYMYAENVPVHDAWLQLHKDKKRNFFAYGSDVALLRAIQPRLLQCSPKHDGDIKSLCPPVPNWLEKMDGSLPSRVLPYMYLGNLGHADNPEMLRELGIGQVLSVGEPINWDKDIAAQWPQDNLLYVDKVQDNGVDPLTEDFGRCLEFIGELFPSTAEFHATNHILFQNVVAATVLQPWYTVASVFLAPRPSVLLKS